MDEISVAPIAQDTIANWSALWIAHWKGNDYLLRSHDIEYYLYRYTNNEYSKAYYCSNITGDIIGYCGVNTISCISRGRTYKLAALSDVIIAEPFRMHGYAREFLLTLARTALCDHDAFLFFPVDRSALISWRFLSKVDSTLEMNRWCISLRDLKANARTPHPSAFVEIPSLAYLREWLDTTFIRWRYAIHPERYQCHRIDSSLVRGYILSRTVRVGSVTGVELCRVLLERPASRDELWKLMYEMMFYFKNAGAEAVFYKVPTTSHCDAFFDDWSLSKKAHEKKYGLTVNSRVECHLDSEDLEQYVCGEELDTPREASFVRTIF